MVRLTAAPEGASVGWHNHESIARRRATNLNENEASGQPHRQERPAHGPKASHESAMATCIRLLPLLTLLLVGCSSTSSPVATMSVPTAVDQRTDLPTRPAPLVRVDSAVTPIAQVGGEIILEFNVTNVGPRDIRDLTIIVNDAYLAKMAVLETKPPAIRHNEQGGEYFTFGALPKGAMQTYQIRMSPNDPGDFTAEVDLAEWSAEDMVPLPEADGGVAEYAYDTEVLPR